MRPVVYSSTAIVLLEAISIQIGGLLDYKRAKELVVFHLYADMCFIFTRAIRESASYAFIQLRYFCALHKNTSSLMF